MRTGLLHAELGNPVDEPANDDAVPMRGTALARPAGDYPIPEDDQGGSPFMGPAVELSDPAENDLVGYVRRRFEIMTRFRHKRNLYDRFRFALRSVNGEYDPGQLAEIRAMGGAETFSQLVSSKAQAATALLQDIYLSGDLPWAIKPTPEPEIAPDAQAAIEQLVASEVSTAMQMNGGQPVPPDAIEGRRKQLREEIARAVKEKARKEAEKANKRALDVMREGDFFRAMSDFLIDLPVFPYAVIKGPVVEMRSKLEYGPPSELGGRPSIDLREVPTLTWRRVSPLDVYFIATSSSVAGSDIIERVYYTRHDLSALLDVPGWRHDRIHQVLAEFPDGLHDWQDTLDEERASMEGRESPTGFDSETICGVEYHGFVQGRKLIDLGVEADLIPDENREYLAQLWIVGPYVLKAQVSPSLRRRHPYFITAYRKMPGSLIGFALPDQLRDTQDVANAALRNLVNNMGLSSGPQVVVLANRFSEGTDTTQIYPWKQWLMEDEPGQGSVPPIQFFQPKSNAQELLGIYKEMMTMADEVSLIPRYQHGGQAAGAGRTASGLSMLMSNASKLQQMVALNIDEDIIGETLRHLYDMLMLTSDDLRGDERIEVWGVKKVAAMEADRARMTEVLQLSANPIDAQLFGAEGRADLWREVLKGMRFENGEIVPTKDEIAERARQAAEMQQMQAAAEAQGSQGGADANPKGPRTNSVQARDMSPARRGGAQ